MADTYNNQLIAAAEKMAEATTTMAAAMETVMATMSEKMTMMTAAKDDNCGGIGGIKNDNGDSGPRMTTAAVLAASKMTMMTHQ